MDFILHLSCNDSSELLTALTRSIDEQDLYPSFNEMQPSRLRYLDVDDKKERDYLGDGK